MSFCKYAGIITGFIVATLIINKYAHKKLLLKNPDRRYDVNDFLTDQNL